MEQGADRRSISLTESALRSRRFGAYTLQAAIAAVHVESSSAVSTDWREIKLLYDRLLQVQPSLVVELNRAVAVALCEGPEQDLRLISGLLARGALQLSSRALCPCGFVSQIRADSGGTCFLWKALALAQQEPERRFLARRLRDLK